MRVNSVQNSQKSEIVATSRKQGTNPSFQSNKAKALLSQDVIDHFGLNLKTAVKYEGKPAYTPAPETLGEKLSNYFHQLKVDWNTHIDPNKISRRFE